jgi:hypothetical protein
MTTVTASSPLEPALGFARRSNVLIGGGAAVTLCAVMVGAALFLTRPAAAPTAETAAPARPGPPLPASAMKDRWFEESAPAVAVPAVSAQARDGWYLDRASVNLPAVHVIDRWYLDAAPISPAPLSTQARDTWYLDN